MQHQAAAANIASRRSAQPHPTTHEARGLATDADAPPPPKRQKKIPHVRVLCVCVLACAHTTAKPSVYIRAQALAQAQAQAQTTFHMHTKNSHSRCRYVKRGRGFRFAVTIIFRPRDVRRALSAHTTTLTAMRVGPKVRVRLRTGVDFEIVHLVFFAHLRPPNEVGKKWPLVYTAVPPHTKRQPKNVCVSLCLPVLRSSPIVHIHGVILPHTHRPHCNSVQLRATHLTFKSHAAPAVTGDQNRPGC